MHTKACTFPDFYQPYLSFFTMPPLTLPGIQKLLVYLYYMYTYRRFIDDCTYVPLWTEV